MNGIAERRFERRFAYIDLMKDMLLSYNSLVSSIDNLGDDPPTPVDYTIPVLRFNQLVESIRTIQDRLVQKPKQWEFSILPADMDGERLMYTIDVRTKALTVAEPTPKGFRHIRKASMPEITPYLLPAGIVLINNSRGSSPLTIARHVAQFDLFIKIVMNNERSL